MSPHLTPAEPLAPGDVRTIALIGVAHGTSHFFHLMLPPLFPWLMRDFSLGFTAAGALMTLFFVVSGIGQALAGFVVDRWGARRVLFGGLALLSLSGFLVAVAQNYAMLAFAAAVAGLGNSVFHPADFTILNRRVSQPRLGHAFSVHGLVGNLGWAIAPVVMAGTAALAGWQAAGLLAGGFGAAMLALLWWQRDALATEAQQIVRSEAQPGAAGPASAFAFLGVAAVWLCFGYLLLTTMAFGALQNFAPAVLGSLYGLSLATATSALSASLVGGAAGIAVGGFVAARGLPQERVIFFSLAVSAGLALLLSQSVVAPWAVLPLMVLLGFGAGVAGPSRDLLVRQAATATLGPAAFGRIYGFVYSGLDIGLACAPLVFGRLMDGARVDEVLVGVALLQAAAILTALAVGTRRRAAAASTIA